MLQKSNTLCRGIVQTPPTTKCKTKRQQVATLDLSCNCVHVALIRNVHTLIRALRKYAFHLRTSWKIAKSHKELYQTTHAFLLNVIALWLWHFCWA